MKPIRVQRKRSKGWKMPENTVSVCRPGKWGNPFIINPHVAPGSKSGAMYICVPNAYEAVKSFEAYMEHCPDLIEDAKKELRGKNLACFCSPKEPCHADVLLKLANS